jgi:hypothetical protein
MHAARLSVMRRHPIGYIGARDDYLAMALATNRARRPAPRAVNLTAPREDDRPVQTRHRVVNRERARNQRRPRAPRDRVLPHTPATAGEDGPRLAERIAGPTQLRRPTRQPHRPLSNGSIRRRSLGNVASTPEWLDSSVNRGSLADEARITAWRTCHLRCLAGCRSHCSTRSHGSRGRR